MEIAAFQKSLPQSIADLTDGFECEQILTGHSGSQVFLLKQPGGKSFYLKTVFHKRFTQSELAEEKSRLDWLAEKLPVPQVLKFVRDRERDYLLISEINGFDASDEAFANDPQKVIEELARGLTEIHSLSIKNCPFDARLEKKIRLAQFNVEQNLVDEEDFDEQRLGGTAANLFEELIVSKPTREDLVFTHGDYCLPNIVLKDFNLSGFIDWGRAGIADRYQDIALLVRSVESNFGQQWLPFLFESLKLEPDREKISFYQLLDEFF